MAELIPKPAPFAGVVVIDLTQIYNGPYATFLLAQAGATVIKVEPPRGEHLRARRRAPGITEPFAVLNANKRSVVLDLKSEAGVEVLLALAEQADVIVENFAPGVMERLGLSEAVLRARNPQLIIASSSGYGSTGPYRDYPAMDVTVQAMSGVLAVTGLPDGAPVKAGPAVSDFFGGVHLYGAIVTALYRRATTGAGSSVEVSMMSAVYPSLLSNLGLAQRGAQPTQRTGNRHGGLNMAPYNVYPTKDGAIAILSVTEAHWLATTTVLGHPEWREDPRFSSHTARVKHMDALDALIAADTQAQSKSELCQRLVKARVPCAPVRELSEVIEDPHLHETGMLEWIEHPRHGRILVHRSPLVFKDEPRADYQPSSDLGADTRAVLAELCGFDAQRIEAFAQQGAFSTPATK
ncbi:MAG TPA: CoA transferase [Polyangiales bacterium]|nr:CoA transferase [Polyangiales bacterium]